jgi:hypothetical protein
MPTSSEPRFIQKENQSRPQVQTNERKPLNPSYDQLVVQPQVMTTNSYNINDIDIDKLKRTVNVLRNINNTIFGPISPFLSQCFYSKKLLTNIRSMAVIKSDTNSLRQNNFDNLKHAKEPSKIVNAKQFNSQSNIKVPDIGEMTTFKMSADYQMNESGAQNENIAEICKELSELKEKSKSDLKEFLDQFNDTIDELSLVFTETTKPTADYFDSLLMNENNNSIISIYNDSIKRQREQSQNHFRKEVAQVVANDTSKEVVDDVNQFR